MTRDVLTVLGGVLLAAIGWVLGFLHALSLAPPRLTRAAQPAAKGVPAAALTPDPAEERRQLGLKLMAAGKKFHQCHDARCKHVRRRAHDCHDLNCPARQPAAGALLKTLTKEAL